MIKAPLDQGLPRTTANLLRERGRAVQHVSEYCMFKAEDSAIIDLAQQEQRMVLTLDADSRALLAVLVLNHAANWRDLLAQTRLSTKQITTENLVKIDSELSKFALKVLLSNAKLLMRAREHPEKHCHSTWSMVNMADLTKGKKQ